MTPGGSVQAIAGPATYINHGPPDANTVALTFHLGGNPTLVGELLDLLKTSGVTSTLFAIGDWLSANPTLGHRAVDDGNGTGESHQEPSVDVEVAHAPTSVPRYSEAARH